MKKFIVFKRLLALLLIIALAILLIGPSASAQGPIDTGVMATSTARTKVAVGTSIPYQGQLKDNGAAANGVYDFQFKLYDDASAGSQVGSDVNQEDVAVANGLFSVALDFGSSPFNGEARYLEIGVRSGASTGAYTMLAPRRSLLASPYAQYSNATRGLSVAGSGNVGIGTTDPFRPLEVMTSNSGATNNLVGFGTTDDGGKGSLFGVDTTNRVMYWRLNDSGDYGWQFQDNQGQSRLNLSRLGNIDIPFDSRIGHSPDTDVFPYKSHDLAVDALGWFNPGDGSEMWLSGRTNLTFFTQKKFRMVVAANGNVGINTDSPTALLSVNGDANKMGDGMWGTFSDARMKKNVGAFTDGLDVLMNINPVHFQYNGLGGSAADGKQYVGVLAQEVEQVAPYMVSKVATKGFADQRVYNGSALTYILVNAVQEQQTQIKALQAENGELHNKLAETEQLRKEVAELKTLVEQLGKH